jgi:hypothetical protein
MDERSGATPLLGRNKTSERDAPPTEWNGGDGIRIREEGYRRRQPLAPSWPC